MGHLLIFILSVIVFLSPVTAVYSKLMAIAYLWYFMEVLYFIYKTPEWPTTIEYAKKLSMYKPLYRQLIEKVLARG